MSNKSEQAERRALAGSNNAVTLRAGDREPTTLHAMANLDTSLDGRFGKADRVSGDAPTVDYPRLPASSPWACDPIGLEPPLGIEVDALEPTGTPAEVAASFVGAEASAVSPSAVVVETASANPIRRKKLR